VREDAEKVIAEVLRPLVEADGGRIELVEASPGRVVVRLTGACSGCPGKPYTLERVVEPVLRRALGQDLEVEVV
jgi:Fe-S cluster biogenesis protein NfuA